MDLDEVLLQEWEDDTSLLDIDVTTSLQSHENIQESSLSTQHFSKGETFLEQIDEDLDYALDLALQTDYNEDLKENGNNNSKKSLSSITKDSKPLSIIDEQWELIDPHPDIHALFKDYDTKFFYGKLKGVEIKWSPRMTASAGICSYEGRGGLCSVRLSAPLLKLRPRKDLVETLLHEMIHAYLLVTHNNKDRDGHGPEFLSHMNRINKETGARISVYHSFHDEVELYRQHWWKCDGPCQERRPFFGLVKRAMNRAPGPKDPWWATHQASCGGNFMKIKEPDGYNKKKNSKRKHPSASENKGSGSDIRSFLKDDSSACGSHDNNNPPRKCSTGSTLKSIMSKEENISLIQTGTSPKKNFIPFQGTGYKLGGNSEKSSSLSVHEKIGLASGSSPLDMASHLKTPKLSGISNFRDTRKVQKDKAPSTLSSTSSNASKKFIQSPIERFFTSRTVPGSSSHVKKSEDVAEEELKSDTSKVLCPVCSILIKEERINSHLDKCLLNK